MNSWHILLYAVAILSRIGGNVATSSIFLQEQNINIEAKPQFIYFSVSLANNIKELKKYNKLIVKLKGFKDTQSKSKQKYLSSILLNIKESIEKTEQLLKTIEHKSKRLEVPNGDKNSKMWNSQINWRSHQYMQQNLKYIQKRSILKNIMHSGIKLISDNLDGFMPLHNLIKLGKELFIKIKPENTKIDTKIIKEIRRVNSHYNELTQKLNRTDARIFNNQLSANIIMLTEKIIRVCNKMDHLVELLFNTIFSGKLTYGIFDAQEIDAAIRQTNTDLRRNGRLITEFNPYKMKLAVGLEWEKELIHIILKVPTKRVADYKVIQLLTKRLIINTKKGLKIIKITSNEAYVKNVNAASGQYSIINKPDVNKLINSMYHENSIKLWTNKKPDCLEVIEKQSLRSILNKCSYMIEDDNAVAEIITDNKICVHSTVSIYARKICKANTDLMIIDKGSNLIKMETGCVFQINNKSIKINEDFVQVMQSSINKHYHQINLPINLNETSVNLEESNSDTDVTAIINLFIAAINLVAISILYARIIWLKYNQMRNQLQGN